MPVDILGLPPIRWYGCGHGNRGLTGVVVRPDGSAEVVAPHPAG